MDDLNLEYLTENWRRVLELTGDHLRLSVAAIALALVFAVPLGILAARFRILTTPILGLVGALYTVPSLAFLGLLVATPIGIGFDNALIVLTAYAQLFLVRNISAGLRGVDAATLEAARGIGMTPLQVFRQVRWPLALPLFVAGMRTALVSTISLATVAAFIGAGGLGRLIFDGLSLQRPNMILAGAIAIVLLAWTTDAVVRLAERLTAVARAERAIRQA
ncbi:MAG: L-proline glycine betaine ABC transport system permease protein ProW [uncultured Thermomicrobiales bacterium]|uniref:L-proline glycine betaine ABC transport system permease protein ProW n=1 Tax=uncultured Thermomicrobiales bacterium TaxID=1645740 RepID=A0A6J4U108_9BACT|nr:MAG: L-proline glycine betaine ABC transport system permease protein ProW [uncultured Thermomicrobiales bacterium]